MRRSRRAAAAGLAGGLLTGAAFAAAPAADATCASAFGFGSGGQCSSTLFSVAIALGENAEAHADGILGAALTLGGSSSAAVAAGALLNLAVTIGDNNSTVAGGIASAALVANSVNQTVLAGADGFDSGTVANLAISLASPQATETIANGIANVTVNLAGSGNVYGRGIGLTTLNAVGLSSTLYNAGLFNTVVNVLGNNNLMSNLDGQGGLGNLAFTVIGSDNFITTSGALAVAGALGSSGQAVNQAGPGVTVAVNRQAATRVARGARTETYPADSHPETETGSEPARVRTGHARAGRGGR